MAQSEISARGCRMAHEFIKVEQHEGVLLITMDDPGTRNAMGSEMAAEINEELDCLESAPELRVLVLTGKDPAFCSGANVRRMNKEVQERGNKASQEMLPVSPWERMEARWMWTRRGQREEGVRFLPLRIHELQKPSIAAINGYAMGVGMGLAIACDIRIASEKAGLSEAFIRNGLIPADGSCWQLPRMIGLGNTLLLQYTGDIIDAQEAYRLGLVNRVAPHEKLMETTMELAQRLAQGPTYSMALTKWLVHKSLYTDLRESLELAGTALEIARQTEDHREGVRAFLEKRKPVFKGR